MRGARAAKRDTPATGYAAVESATNMLNEMIEETRTNLDTEETRCTTEDRRMSGSMEVMRTAVSNFNGAAAGARGRVVGAQGEIGTLEVNKESTEEAFEQHKTDCINEKKALRDEHAIVAADAVVMSSVLRLLGPCPAQEGQALTLGLTQCDSCGNVMLQHPDIHNLLTGLKSKIAKSYVADNLKEAYEDASENQAPVALTQEGEKHMRNMFGMLTQDGEQVMKSIHAHNKNDPATPPPLPDFASETNVSEVPEVPSVVDCAPAPFKVTPGSCRKLKDRFLNVQAGILDQKETLEKKMDDKDLYCTTQSGEFTTQIEKMAGKLAEERTKLAVATEEQNQAESGSHTQSQAHDTMSFEYTRTMTECCENQNTMKGEICALEKIRTELNMVEGAKVFITDCEVSDWMEEACSKECV